MADAPKPRGKYAVKDNATLKLARERWKFADDAEGKQAQREIDDLGFYAGDEKQQWGETALAMRRGSQSTGGPTGMPAVPDRPTLVINKVLEPVRQVENEIDAADIGMQLVPADDFGDVGVTVDDTEVLVREGLLRKIMREAEAEAAEKWGGNRATIAGRGYYQVATRYLPGKTHNQEIYLHRIYNQAGVKLDPSRQLPDGSDADWGFVGSWMPWDRFADTYPKLADGSDNPFEGCGEDDFIAMNEPYPEWYQIAAPAVKDSGKSAVQTAVRIVDYWYTERNARELLTLVDGTDVWEDELPDDANVEILDQRTVIEKSIKFCKIGGGVMILEETDWAGPDLPIIEVLGEELQPYDDQRRAIGMVRPARGAQQGFNYMISKLVETVGLTPIAPIIFDPDAIDGYEEWWKQAATRAFYGLPHRTYDDQGRQLASPSRPNVDPNLQPMSLSLGMFDQLIKSTTAVPDPTLGNVDPALKSGKAIREVVSNAKNSTSNFLGNRVISKRRAATVINNLLYPIYGQPGRVVQIMTGTNEPQKMMIGHTDTADPMAAQINERAKQRAMQVGILTKEASFNIIVKVVKNEESRRQQEAQALGELISADPQQMMATFGDLYFLNSDIPGHKELAERAKAMLAPQIQAMLAQKDGTGPTPQMMAQQLGQMKEQLQHAEAAMKELAQEADGKRLDAQTKIQTETLRHNAELERARIEADKELKLQQMKDATSITVARINAETKGIISSHESVDEALALNTQLAHDAEQAALDRQHQQSTTVAGMAHDAASADGERDFQSQQADQDRQAAAAQSEPEPTA